MTGDVTMIIPQRGLATLTIECVRSLREWEGNRPAVMVVDDGSADDSASRVRNARLSNCGVIEQPPRGVTAAWNRGVRAARTSHIVLLNNDVVVRGRFLERLLDPLRTRRAQIVGVEWRIEPLVPRRLGTRLLAGWCLAFHVELWRRLGGFDESMQLYWSDTDFQCRAMEYGGEFGKPAPDSVLHSAGPLPLTHLGHQTVRHEPQRSSQWRHDRAAFLRTWGEDSGCCRCATSDGSSAGRRRAPGR